MRSRSENNFSVLSVVRYLSLLASIGFFSYLAVVLYFFDSADQEIEASLPIQRAFLPDSAELKKQEPEPVSFLFFGDLMLDRHVGEIIVKNGLDHIFSPLFSASSTFSAAKEEIIGSEPANFKHDIVGVNLEGAVTDDGAHYAPSYSYDFAFHPKLISQLKPYGFTFFNLANNHIYDQGEKGWEETLKNLAELEMAFSGCPDKKIGDCTAIIKEIKDKKIGLAGFSMVYGLFDLARATGTIAELASSTDFTIVNIHWGTEYAPNFGQTQQRVARELIKSGVDVIIGHHPHVAQGVEIFEGKPIFYSLGNFVFDQYFSRETQEGYGVEIIYNEGEAKYRILPIVSQKSRVRFMDGKERAAFLKKLVSLSECGEAECEQIESGRLESVSTGF